MLPAVSFLSGIFIMYGMQSPLTHFIMPLAQVERHPAQNAAAVVHATQCQKDSFSKVYETPAFRCPPKTKFGDIGYIL
jgi:hypothetical protein